MQLPKDIIQIPCENATWYLRLGFREWGMAEASAKCEPISQVRTRGKQKPLLIHAGEGKPLVCARPYQHGGLAANVLGSRLIPDARPWAELKIHMAALHKNLPVVEPVGLWHSTPKDEKAQWYFLSLWAEGFCPLTEIIQVKRPFPVKLIHATAAAVRHLHKEGLFHHDLNLHNILVKENGEGGRSQEYGWDVRFIDLDRSTLSENLPVKMRLQNLERLHRSAEKICRAMPLDLRQRMLFINTYAGTDLILKQHIMKRFRNPSLHDKRHRIGWRLGLG